MEIGIPLLALGGMYIIANKDNVNKNQNQNQNQVNKITKKVEGFDNYPSKSTLMDDNYKQAQNQESAKYIQSQKHHPLNKN